VEGRPQRSRHQRSRRRRRRRDTAAPTVGTIILVQLDNWIHWDDNRDDGGVIDDDSIVFISNRMQGGPWGSLIVQMLSTIRLSLL
jgi:hypothetical protein